jgi:hypothetical protein
MDSPYQTRNIDSGENKDIHALLAEDILRERQLDRAKKQHKAIHSLKWGTFSKSLKIIFLPVAIILAFGLIFYQLIKYLDSEDCPVMLRLHLAEKLSDDSPSLGQTEQALGAVLIIAFAGFLICAFYLLLTHLKFMYNLAKLQLTPRMFTSFLLMFPLIVWLLSRLYLLLFLAFFDAFWLTNILYTYYWRVNISENAGLVFLCIFACLGLWHIPLATQIRDSFMQWNWETFGSFPDLNKLIIIALSLLFYVIYLGIITLGGIELGLYFQDILMNSMGETT